MQRASESSAYPDWARIICQNSGCSQACGKWLAFFPNLNLTCVIFFQHHFSSFLDTISFNLFFFMVWMNIRIIKCIPRVGIVNDTRCAPCVPLSSNILMKWLALGLVSMAAAVLSLGSPISLKYLVWWDLHRLLRHGLWRPPLWIRIVLIWKEILVLHLQQVGAFPGSYW